MLRAKKRLVLVASVLGVGCLAAGIAYATIPNSGVINGCYSRSGGTLRVIDASVTNCKATETSLAWNVTGAQGTQGLQGIQGIQGIQGVPGPSGVSGYQIVSVTIPDVADGDSGFFSDAVYPIACPAGKKVIGGGVTTSFGNNSGPRLAYSGPSADGTHWHADIKNTTGSDNMDITGYAICATMAP
jgi:hypothetical protein